MARTAFPLTFGLTVGTRPYADALELGQLAERVGFSRLTFSDRPPDPSLEGWTLSTGVAVQTEKVVIAHNTLNIPFRNVALTAKMAATLDLMTGGGRVELMLGAGGQALHYQAIGIVFGSAGERFQDLRDAVEILRGLWANEKFSYNGRVNQTDDATIGIKPAGPIPIWIGALGPRMMRYTGAVADGWLKNQGWPTSLDQLRELVGLLEDGAEKAGRDPKTVRRALNGGASFAGEASTQAYSGRAGTGIAGMNVVGEPAAMLEQFESYRDEGIDTFQLRFEEDGIREHIVRFGEEVIAKAR